ncbi:MAG: hypothetical protein HY644_04395 [Acidobacteria bacterium]|nr:hypothetical protein [Acidobacteriota bacterium]
MAKTEEASFAFTLKERATSQYAILCEPRDRNLSVLGDGFLMLRLRPGLSFGHAEQIRKFLQENIAALTYTVP